MAKITKIEGLDELIKAFADLGPEAEKDLSETAVECAKIIQAKAKAKVHSVSGELAKNIKVGKVTKKNLDAHKVMARVYFTSKTAHGVPLELGHKLVFYGKETGATVAPRPFMRPAADESKDETINKIVASMNGALAKMGGLK